MNNDSCIDSHSYLQVLCSQKPQHIYLAMHLVSKLMPINMSADPTISTSSTDAIYIYLSILPRLPQNMHSFNPLCSPKTDPLSPPGQFSDPTSAPQEPCIVDYDKDYAEVGWTPPAKENGAPVDKYIVEYREKNKGDFKKVCCCVHGQVERK